MLLTSKPRSYVRVKYAPARFFVEPRICNPSPRSIRECQIILCAISDCDVGELFSALNVSTDKQYAPARFFVSGSLKNQRFLGVNKPRICNPSPRSIREYQIILCALSGFDVGELSSALNVSTDKEYAPAALFFTERSSLPLSPRSIRLRRETPFVSVANYDALPEDACIKGRKGA